MAKALTVLQLFLNNPGRYFSVREVSKICRIDWLTASKAIQEIIIKTGIIEEDKSVVVGWRRFRLWRKLQK